jgi:hypothetical protein
MEIAPPRFWTGMEYMCSPDGNMIDGSGAELAVELLSSQRLQIVYVVGPQVQHVVPAIQTIQSCGSGFSESGSGSSILSESGSRVLMTKNKREKKIQTKNISLIKNCNLLKSPSYRRRLQPLKVNIQHFKK